MDAFRAKLETQPGAFRAIIAPLADFAIGGDQYKKTLNPEIPADLQSWYQRKSFYLVMNRPIEDRIFGTAFAEELALEFRRMAPLYRYIWQLKVTMKACLARSIR